MELGQAQLILLRLSQVCAVSWQVDWMVQSAIGLHRTTWLFSTYLSFPPGINAQYVPMAMSGIEKEKAD